MNKELYQNAIQIIDILLNKRFLSNEDGINQFGEAQWGILREWFKIQGRGAIFLSFNAMNLQSQSEAKTLRLQCENIIKRIEQEEYDRNLQNRESEANIKGVRNAKITSWIAIVISILSLIVAILSATIWKQGVQ